GLGQTDVFFEPIIERGIPPFRRAFRLDLGHDLQGGAPLQQALHGETPISRPLHHVERLPQITFIMRIAATERSEMTSFKQRTRPLVLRKRTFRAEQFESRRASPKQAQSFQSVPKQTVLAPERMRDQAKAPLPFDFVD